MGESGRMPKHVPLPDRFERAAFSTRDGADAGLGRERLRGPDLQRPFSGVRIPTSSPLTLRRMCAAYLLRSPDGHLFSQVTAARLWRMPLPRRLETVRPLDVAVVKPRAIPRANGVHGHRLAERDLQVVRRFGMPVTDALSTWCRLGSVLSHDDLVAAGDHLVLDPRIAEPGGRRPYVGLDQLRAGALRYRGPGALAIRSAARDVRSGAESRRETLLRLLLVRGGLPEPELGQEIRDGTGTPLGYADMLYRNQRVIVEYDGDQHRNDFDQFEKDAVRLDSFRRAGHYVVQVRKKGLGSRRHETVRRVAEALSL